MSMHKFEYGMKTYDTRRNLNHLVDNKKINALCRSKEIKNSIRSIQALRDYIDSAFKEIC